MEQRQHDFGAGGHALCDSTPHLSKQDPVMTAFLPCPAGAKLLQAFAAARPEDYGFVEPADFLNLRSSAFSGIPEWDEFAEHVSGCSRCGEV